MFKRIKTVIENTLDTIAEMKKQSAIANKWSNGEVSSFLKTHNTSFDDIIKNSCDNDDSSLDKEESKDEEEQESSEEKEIQKYKNNIATTIKNSVSEYITQQKSEQKKNKKENGETKKEGKPTKNIEIVDDFSVNKATEKLVDVINKSNYKIKNIKAVNAKLYECMSTFISNENNRKELLKKLQAGKITTHLKYNVDSVIYFLLHAHSEIVVEKLTKTTDSNNKTTDSNNKTTDSNNKTTDSNNSNDCTLTELVGGLKNTITNTDDGDLKNIYKQAGNTLNAEITTGVQSFIKDISRRTKCKYDDKEITKSIFSALKYNFDGEIFDKLFISSKIKVTEVISQDISAIVFSFFEENLTEQLLQISEKISAEQQKKDKEIFLLSLEWLLTTLLKKYKSLLNALENNKIETACSIVDTAVTNIMNRINTLALTKQFFLLNVANSLVHNIFAYTASDIELIIGLASYLLQNNSSELHEVIAKALNALQDNKRNKQDNDDEKIIESSISMLKKLSSKYLASSSPFTHIIKQYVGTENTMALQMMHFITVELHAIAEDFLNNYSKKNNGNSKMNISSLNESLKKNFGIKKYTQIIEVLFAAYLHSKPKKEKRREYLNVLDDDSEIHQYLKQINEKNNKKTENANEKKLVANDKSDEIVDTLKRCSETCENLFKIKKIEHEDISNIKTKRGFLNTLDNLSEDHKLYNIALRETYRKILLSSVNINYSYDDNKSINELILTPNDTPNCNYYDNIKLFSNQKSALRHTQKTVNTKIQDILSSKNVINFIKELLSEINSYTSDDESYKALNIMIKNLLSEKNSDNIDSITNISEQLKSLATLIDNKKLLLTHTSLMPLLKKATPNNLNSNCEKIEDEIKSSNINSNNDKNKKNSLCDYVNMLVNDNAIGLYVNLRVCCSLMHNKLQLLQRQLVINNLQIKKTKNENTSSNSNLIFFKQDTTYIGNQEFTQKLIHLSDDYLEKINYITHILHTFYENRGAIDCNNIIDNPSADIYKITQNTIGI